MPTDTERREVARRLRELRMTAPGVTSVGHGYLWSLLWAVFGDELEELDRSDWLERMCSRLADLIEPQPITGDTSDGYHTFDELYDHRANLFSVIVRCFKDRAWKSKLHHDGTMYDGMFIVGVETSQGQATYHYDIDPYWDIFDCKNLARAPEWDGHTPEQAISRIASLRPSCDRDALLALADEMDSAGEDGLLVRDSDLMAWADRIREALGADDGR